MYVWRKQSCRSVHISSTPDCLVACCTTGAETVKLGRGAMGSRLRDHWAPWTDASVFARSEQWKGLILAMVTPQEANLLCTRNILDEDNKIKYNTRGLTLKDLKPQTLSKAMKEQTFFPPVVRRILFMSRAGTQRLSSDVGIGCPDAKVE